jgi:hypothetical protein
MSMQGGAEKWTEYLDRVILKEDDEGSGYVVVSFMWSQATIHSPLSVSIVAAAAAAGRMDCRRRTPIANRCESASSPGTFTCLFTVG